MFETNQLHLATRCLWALQEAMPDIQGLSLATTSGLSLAATFANRDSAQRLAAMSAALFLLGEHATSAWGRGQALDMRLSLTFIGDNARLQGVTLRPIAEYAVFMAVYRLSSGQSLLTANLDIATSYLIALLDNNQELPPLRWATA